jgi:hypothetical protein
MLPLLKHANEVITRLRAMPSGGGGGFIRPPEHPRARVSTARSRGGPRSEIACSMTQAAAATGLPQMPLPPLPLPRARACPVAYIHRIFR